MGTLTRERNPLLEECTEARTLHFAARPITFAQYLELSEGRYEELTDGVLMEKPMVQLDHEKLFAWLFWLLHGYVRQRNLGIVLGSRTAVPINQFRGRLPDIVFVRNEREHIVEQKAITAAPDLVIELVSPGDRPSTIFALETDYRNIGVTEIAFIDRPHRHVRVLHRRDNDYEETVLTTGTLAFETIPGFEIQAEWLFDEPRPNEYTLLQDLLSRSETQG